MIKSESRREPYQPSGSVANDVLRSLLAYLKAQFWNALIVLALYIGGFALAGVPWWFLTGFLAGVINLVPHFGPVLALVCPLFLTWLSTGTSISLLWIGLVWLLIQIIDGFVLGPRAASRAGVNPFLAIVITIIAAFIFGPVGMLLAVPIVSIILVISRAVGRSAA